MLQNAKKAEGSGHIVARECGKVGGLDRSHTYGTETKRNKSPPKKSSSPSPLCLFFCTISYLAEKFDR